MLDSLNLATLGQLNRGSKPTESLATLGFLSSSSSPTIQEQIEELNEVFGSWQKRGYEVPDGRLVQAEREIAAQYGTKVSIDKKAKSLIKFGKTAPLSVERETVWNVGGHEDYVTNDLITHVSSSDASDTQVITLECHTVEGSGVDAKFTFLSQSVTLDGQNPVALTTPVARVSRLYNDDSTELKGSVYVYEFTPTTGGVPDDLTKVHSKIDQGFQQSFKGATTFSDNDYYILTGGFGSVSNKQAAAIDFFLEVREAGKVFREVAAISANSAGSNWQIDLDPAVIIPKNADVRITCQSSTQGAVAYCAFKGYLARVVTPYDR